MTIEFEYNVEAENAFLNRPDYYIPVIAHKLTNGEVHIEFPLVPAYKVLAVTNWTIAINHIISLAKTEFEQREAIEQTKQIIAA